MYAHGINNFLDDHNIHSITKSSRPQDKKQDTPINLSERQLAIEAPKTQFNTDGLFAGYDFETQELFSSAPSTVFNDLNRLEPQEFKPIRLNVFDSIDVNKDNIITLKEFTSYYKKFGNTDENIKETFNNLDENGDNVLSRNEV